MAIPPIIKEVAVLTAKELIAWCKAKRAKEAAQEKYATTPMIPRGCPKCKEVAYSPGQVKCFKCNSSL